MKLIKGFSGNIDMAKTILRNLIFLLEGDEATAKEMFKACKKLEKWFERETGTAVDLEPYTDYFDDIWNVDFTSKLGRGTIVLLDD